MRPQHPKLVILDTPIRGEDVREGFDPFRDIVHAETRLGYFGANRAFDDTWSWFLVTVKRDEDDFDTIGCEDFRTLEECINNADRQLRHLLARS